MVNNDPIRAWKDEAYRLQLTEAEQAELPENPAGLIELNDEEMELVAGGCGCRTRHYNHQHCHHTRHFYNHHCHRDW